jgi:dTDP-4-amino-4,6-dideoxygalactose transaminase
MRNTFLPLASPSLGEEEIAEVVETLRTDWITTGPKVKRFEEEFAAAVKAPAALALNSCTAALHLALRALDVGPGDAVITTPLTFCSGVHVIEHCGARPILADVEPDTLNLDPTQVRRVLQDWKRTSRGRERIKAILAVHLYGHPCDMDALAEIAAEHGLAIVEDAAHALPARDNGRTIGAPLERVRIPLLTCFSFYATKNLTTGEGGMLTGPPDLIEEARILSLHGMSRDAWKRYAAGGSWFYEVTRLGFKYNMTDIQAAIGLQQLRKLSQFHARRSQIAHKYQDAFRGIEPLVCPAERPGVQHAWHIYALRLGTERLGISRDRFIEELRNRNIGSSVHFIPIHLHRYYRDKYGFRAEDFPVALSQYEALVSLPLCPRMSDQDVNDVIEAVAEIAGRASVQPAEQRRRAASQATA